MNRVATILLLAFVAPVSSFWAADLVRADDSQLALSLPSSSPFAPTYLQDTSLHQGTYSASTQATACSEAISRVKYDFCSYKTVNEMKCECNEDADVMDSNKKWSCIAFVSCQ